MSADNPQARLQAAIKAVQEGRTAEAAELFADLDLAKAPPLARALRAYAEARESGNFAPAVRAMTDAVREDPKNTEIYLYLGRAHLMAGQKKAAIRVFHLGLRAGKNQQLISELGALGIRRPPPLPFLKRENLINKYLGILLKKVRIR